LLGRENLLVAERIASLRRVYLLDEIDIFVRDSVHPLLGQVSFILDIKMEEIELGFEMLEILPIFLLDADTIHRELFDIPVLILCREFLVGLIIADDEGIAHLIQSIHDHFKFDIIRQVKDEVQFGIDDFDICEWLMLVIIFAEVDRASVFIIVYRKVPMDGHLSLMC